MITRAAVAILVVLTAAAPARAAVPAVLKAPRATGAMSTGAATPDAASSQAAAPQTPPAGIPGYYDPATQTFTPLAPAPASASTYHGDTDYAILLILSGHTDLAVRLIYVIVDNNFGHTQSGSNATASAAPAATQPSFVVDQYTRTSTVFSSSNSTSTQNATTSFATSSPLVQSRITCNYSENYITYSTSVFVAQQAAKSGTTKQTVTCNL